jgi:VanZ family protein
VYAALVAYLSVAPSSAIGILNLRIPFADKIGHFLMYGVFTAVLFWASDPAARVRPRWIAGLIGGATGYGIAMEMLQKAVCRGDRQFSAGDIAANLAGALAFAGLMVRLSRADAAGDGGRAL